MSDDPLASLSPAQRDSFETFNAFTARDSNTPEEARKSVEMLRDAGWDVQVRAAHRQLCLGFLARVWTGWTTRSDEVGSVRCGTIQGYRGVASGAVVRKAVCQGRLSLYGAQRGRSRISRRTRPSLVRSGGGISLNRC